MIMPTTQELGTLEQGLGLTSLLSGVYHDTPLLQTNKYLLYLEIITLTADQLLRKATLA